MAWILLQFFGEYNSERIMKIGRHLSVKVMNECIVAQFFTHRVQYAPSSCSVSLRTFSTYYVNNFSIR